MEIGKIYWVINEQKFKMLAEMLADNWSSKTQSTPSFLICRRKGSLIEDYLLANVLVFLTF